MLRSLYIKDYALIEEVDVRFESGLNIITGETGAGKSILIDAFGLVLGERATAESIRKGAEKSIVEAIFVVGQHQKLRALLAENDIEWGEELILRREVSVKGTSRCFMNDSPVQLAIMKQAGELLVDLHGQHEHQSLLRKDSHRELLDDFGGLEGLVQEYRVHYHELKQLFQEHDELVARERQLRERRDLYEFQIQEIDTVSPESGEEERLEAELKILENAEKLFEATLSLHRRLYEGDSAGDGEPQALYDRIVLVRNQLEDLAQIDRSFEEMHREAASAVAIVAEISNFIQRYNSKIEFNPERLEQIRERLSRLALLKKKYGGSVEAIIRHREQIGREVELAQNFDGELNALETRIEERRAECSAAAQRLSTKRHELVGKINKGIVAELAKLGIGNARFDVVIKHRPLPKEHGVRAFVKLGREYLEATPDGIDDVEFFISTNVGEDLKPLAKVASGGEISRVMLALKTILAKSQRLPLLIFDEIDVGVSGRIAQAVGKSLKALSQFHQVIAITHLPQIAGLADAHYAVEKVEDKKRARTYIRPLTEEERVEEVARLMSGTEVTKAGLEGARELMGLKANAQ